MSEHTPGPWEWWTSCSWRRLRRSECGVSTDVLMPCVHKDGQADIQVTEADMMLIAAAPDMFAALRLARGELYILLHSSMSHKDFLASVAFIDSAISKATGSAP